MIWRHHNETIGTLLKPGKVLVVYGPRQVGKTTLVKQFLESYPGRTYQTTGEDAELVRILASSTLTQIVPFFTGYDLVFIDEAQNIPDIGKGLKLIVDHIPGLHIIASGSSSFDLSNKLGEPLVGRQRIIQMFPIAVLELAKQYGGAWVYQHLQELLVYGSYPEVVMAPSFEEKINYLNQLRDGYLVRDLLEIGDVRNSSKLLDLLRLVAFQIGQEVSLQELGVQLGMSKNTVERYLDLLQKAFVLVRVGGFSRNLWKEVSKMSRYYFYDNGVRNAIIGNFNALEQRNDIGQLWENFLFIERMKKREYHSIHGFSYFWRTYDQKEIDLVEERNGKLYGYEFKYQPKTKSAPIGWHESYPGSSFEVIHRENFWDFIT